MTADAARARLDELEATWQAATPGPWAQQNGAPNLVYGDPDAGIFVCNTGYDVPGLPDGLPAADAAAIVAAHNALPDLIAVARGVIELAEDLDELSKRTEAAVARFANGEYHADQLGLAMGYRRAAARLRDLLTSVAPAATGQEQR